MSAGWDWFIVIGTIGSLLFFAALLFGNRKTGHDGTTGHVYDGIEEYDNPLPMWWVWMFALSILFAVAYLIYFPGLGRFDGVGGWSSADEVARAQQAHDERFAPLYAHLATLSEDELHASRQAQQVGRRLFINHCATCHGINAGGAFGFPDLRDDEWIWGSGFEPVRTALRQGRRAAMPSWQAALGDDGIVDVTQHVLSFSGQSTDAEAASRGEAAYRTLCVACHGLEGRGNPALGAPDLTNDIWLYGGAPEQIAYTLRHGRNGNMPAFTDVLSEAQIHVLAAYVTSLGGSGTP